MCGFLAFETNKKLLEKSDKELAEYQRLKAKFEGK